MEIDVEMKDCPKMEEMRRYMRLHAIVEDLNSSTFPKTTEWFIEHNHLLHLYDSYFRGGFTGLSPIIQHVKFRQNCVQLDHLINKLMREFNHYHWFSLKDYLQFNMIMIEIVDMTHDFLGEFPEEDDISSMFDQLTV